MAIHESGEMYLETILRLSKTSPYVRAVDISSFMGYSKPSVSRALGVLKEKGYITVDENSLIKLTEPGRQIAENIYDRHQTLSKFLTDLGVDEETAAEDACRIEHYISETSFRAVKTFMKEHPVS